MAMIFPKDTDGDGKLTLSERLGVAVPVGGCPGFPWDGDPTLFLDEGGTKQR